MKEKLLELLKNAYCPYSNFPVAAIVVTKDLKEFYGVNVEDASTRAGSCAERVAFTKAISEGEKAVEYIVVCGGKDLNKLDDCLPCGYCRQFMSEFTNNEFKIFTYDGKNIKNYNMNDLLPNNFKL